VKLFCCMYLIYQVSKETFFNVFVEESNDAFFIVNTVDWAIEWCNQKSADLFEIESRKEFIGKYGPDFHVDSFTEDEVQKNLDKKNLYRTIYRYRTQRGNLFWGLFETKRVTIDGIVYQIVKLIDLAEGIGSWPIQLESTLKERSLNHFVKNNLNSLQNLVHLRLSQSGEGAFNDADILAINRTISTIAILHEQLTYGSNSDNVMLDQYLETLINHIIEIHPNLAIKSKLEIISIEFPADISMKFGMIFNELLGNSIKHAFQTNRENHFMVSFENLSDGNYRMTYEDNGSNSLVREHDWESNNGLGMMVIKALTSEFSGTWKYTINPNGFKGQFDFTY